MIRRYFFAFLGALALFGAATLTTQAQTQSPAPTPAVMQSPACPQIAWSCTQVTDLDPNLDGHPHRIQLTQPGLPANTPSGQPTDFYVACGTETPTGILMTTGNSAYDDRLCLGKDTYAKLQADYGYNLELLNTTNPFRSASGNIDITVKPRNIGDPKNHMCMIGWVVPPATTGSANSGDGSTNPDTAATSGLEYTTFTVNAGIAACTTVYADPFGRVYNKQLKPVPGASVSIFDYDTKALMALPGLTNPFKTSASGIFNFNIPAGRSYLQTSLTNTPLDVHPNYTLAYTAPYAYGDLITETLDKAEQRDIPVSGGATPELKLMGYSHVRLGDYIHIQGIASWPLTMVDVMQGTTIVAQQQADKFGNFLFKLDPTKIDPSEQITLKLTEVDLTTNPKAVAANPATDSVRFDPIPAYLEGYAFNARGEKMPFARVRVRLVVSDGIYYETQANGDALYTISPSKLPILPYYLEIVPANALPGTGGTVVGGTGGTGSTGTETGTSGTGASSSVASKITVPQYAKQNKEYLASQAINVMGATKNGTKVDPTASTRSSEAIYGGSTSGAAKLARNLAAKLPSKEDQTPQSYLTLLLLVALLIFGGSVAVIFIRKRKNAEGPDISGTGSVYTKDGFEE